MKSKKYLNSMLVSAVATSLVAPNVLAASAALTDINKSYAKSSIEYLMKNGIIEGYQDGTFRPTAKMDRQEFATLLGKTLSVKENPKAGERFADVSPWAKGYVGALSEQGIVAGYSDKKFGAKDAVTREQMAVFFVRALGFEKEAYELDMKPTFADSDKIAPYARPAVAFAHAVGFVAGDGKNYNPKDHADRQSVAALATRLHKDDGKLYKENAKKLIQEGMGGDAVSSISITSGHIEGAEYVVKGKAKANRALSVTLTGGTGKHFMMSSKSVFSDKDGNYDIAFDVSGFADGEIVVETGYVKNEEAGDNVIASKTVIKGEGGQPEEKPDGEGTVVATKPVSMTAVNKTSINVTFDNVVKKENGYKFFVNDKEVTSIVYADKTAKLTVPALAFGTDYTVAVKDKDGTAVFSESFKAEFQTITKLVTEKSAYALAAGEQVEITYRVLDEGDRPVKGADVNFRAYKNHKLIDDRTDYVDETLTTDKDGYVTFKYTSYDVREDLIDVIVLDAPLVRSTGVVKVDWSVMKTGLVSVDATEDKSLGAKTERTYNVAFSDEAGEPIPEGTRVYVDLGEKAKVQSGVTIVDVEDAKKDATGNLMVTQETESIVSFVIGNTKGSAKVKIRHNKTGDTLTPQFYYHADEEVADYNIRENDPRLQAGAAKFVAQKPTLDFKQKEELFIGVGGKEVLSLSMTDQFGSDYKGEVTIGLEELMDDLNETNSGAIAYILDIDRDGIGDVIYNKSTGEYMTVVPDEDDPDALVPGDIAGVTVDIEKGTATLDLDILMSETENASGEKVDSFMKKGIVDLGIIGGDGKDVGHILAYANDAKVEGYNEKLPHDKVKVTFVENILKDIILSPKQNTNISKGPEGDPGFVDFEVKFIDQNNKPMSLEEFEDIQGGISPHLAFQVLNSEGKVVPNIKENVDFKLSFLEDVELYDPGMSFDSSALEIVNPRNTKTASYTKTGKDANAIEKETSYMIRFEGMTSGDYTLRAFADMAVKNATGEVAPDQTLQKDEVFAEHKISVSGPVLSGGSLIAIHDYSLDTVTEQFTYVMKDQANKAFQATDDTVIEFTFKNDGNQSISITDINGEPLTNVPAKSEVKRNVKINKTKDKFAFKATPNGLLGRGEAMKLTVTGKVRDHDKTTATDSIKWVNVDEDKTTLDRTDEDYIGSVIAFDKTGGSVNWFVIRTSVGNIKLDFKSEIPTVLNVDGNTAKAIDFTRQLTEGDTVTFKNADGKETFTLMNSN